jgi:endonuclease/exonuclease/phosphatase (EEP) superfamily protein YafD
MKTRFVSGLTLLLLLLLAGCQTPPQVNQVERLLNHPQFPAARQAAPDWSRDALRTINDLQRDLTILQTNGRP